MCRNSTARKRTLPSHCTAIKSISHYSIAILLGWCRFCLRSPAALTISYHRFCAHMVYLTPVINPQMTNISRNVTVNRYPDRGHFFPLNFLSICLKMSWNDRCCLTWYLLLNSSTGRGHEHRHAQCRTFSLLLWAEKGAYLPKHFSEHTQFCQLPTRLHVMQTACWISAFYNPLNRIFCKEKDLEEI